MTKVINNRKQHTINIYTGKLIFAIIIFMLASSTGRAMQNDKNWVIVIDAGHGGRDPGALGTFSREKDITLAIALKTGEYIEQNVKNVKVIYTRKNDTFVEIRDRADIANKNHADLFISIHVNWGEQKYIQGTETFIMGITKDQQNLEVAMKENEVILLENDFNKKYQGFDPKSPESYIMFSLMQNIYQEQSTNLASNIQTQYKERVSRRDRGVKQAGFWVLFMTTMPSVLTETGFITNLAEEKFLNSKQGQDYIASAIFRACRDYVDDIDSKSNISFGQQNMDAEPYNSTKMVAPPGEIVFMVQIATSSSKNEIKPENFNGIRDVVEINSQDRYKYASGNFSDYSEAASYRKKIEAVYPDAFVIAVKDNKILPLQQALEQMKK
jgi:N-acetylmuramoyl-L-alanine amidase